MKAVQQRHVFRLQHHLRRLRIFHQVADLFRTGDRHQLSVLRQQPGERYLAWRAAVLLRQRPYRVQQRGVVIEVFLLKAPVVFAEVAFGEVAVAEIFAGQKTAAQRRVGDKPNIQRLSRRQDRLLDVARPQRIFRLQGGDGMNGVRAAQRFGRDFAQPDMVYLSLFHQAAQARHALFNRRCLADAMEVEKIDAFDAEPLKGVVAAASNIVRLIVDGAAVSFVGRALDAAFGRDFHFAARGAIQPGQELPDKRFIVAAAVLIRRIDKSLVQLDKFV